MCLLVSQIAAHLLVNASKLPMNGNLPFLSIAQDQSRPQIDAVPSQSKSNSKPSKMAPTKKLVLAAKLLNITLTASLVLLANDVSANPGPGPSQPLKMKGLRILHINICSLRNKLTELRLFCDKHRPHVLSLNETWLDDSFLDSELYLPGYQLLRRDRDRHGGGTAVYVAENLNSERVDILSIDDIEALWFDLSQPHSKKILFGAIYRPPNLDPSTFTENLEEMLNRRTNDHSETVLLGDFNFDYISPNTTTKRFQRSMNLFNLEQLINQPTRITQTSRTLIDLIFSTMPELYVSGVLPIGFSDHLAIYGIRKLHRVPLPPPRMIEIRNYKHYDPTLFNNYSLKSRRIVAEYLPSREAAR